MTCRATFLKHPSVTKMSAAFRISGPLSPHPSGQLVTHMLLSHRDFHSSESRRVALVTQMSSPCHFLVPPPFYPVSHRSLHSTESFPCVRYFTYCTETGKRFKRHNLYSQRGSSLVGKFNCIRVCVCVCTDKLHGESQVSTQEHIRESRNSSIARS